jgi:hypothetical protein
MSKNPDNKLYSTPHGFLVADKSVYDRSTSIVMAKSIEANMNLFGPVALTKKADDLRLLYNKTRAVDKFLPRSHGPFKEENPVYVCHICADTDKDHPYPMVFKHGNCLNPLCVNCISRFCAYKSPCPYCQGELRNGFMKLLDVMTRPE